MKRTIQKKLDTWQAEAYVGPAADRMDAVRFSIAFLRFQRLPEWGQIPRRGEHYRGFWLRGGFRDPVVILAEWLLRHAPTRH
jgi:hypothetical protein